MICTASLANVLLARRSVESKLTHLLSMFSLLKKESL